MIEILKNAATEGAKDGLQLHLTKDSIKKLKIFLSYNED
jgi:hypothetical protein